MHKPESPGMSNLDICIPARCIPHGFATATLYDAGKSCSTFIDIRPHGQKTPNCCQQINMAAGGRSVFIITGDERLALGELLAGCWSQTTLCCLLLSSEASWLPCHCHRTDIMDSRAVWGKIKSTPSNFEKYCCV